MSLSAEQIRTLLTGCFRYALGRQSYVVSDVSEILIQEWPNISRHDKELFQREIRCALEHDLAGAQCDRTEWEKVLRLEL